MNQRFELPKGLRNLSLLLIALGAASVVWSFMQDTHRAWASVLLHNYYFLLMGVMGVFFVAVQYVAEAGWSALIKRVPEAFMSVLPVGGIIMLVILVFGLHDLYHWSHENLTTEFLADGSLNPEYDSILASKKAYLNQEFFLTRAVIFIGAWILFASLLRKYSLNEDKLGGLDMYNKSYKVSAIFLPVYAVTFFMSGFDWMMSIEPHWFSTIYGIYTFAIMFVSGTAAITLVVLYLKSKGYLQQVNENHLHDLGKFVFAFSIFWAYIWISQFLLIWYANLPEESAYYHMRWETGYKWLWILNVGVCFLAPFLILMTRDSKRHPFWLGLACVVVLVGHWLDLYVMIMPGILGEHFSVGIPEIGGMMLFVGLFLYLVFRSLSQADLVAKNHPLLEESIQHHI